MDLNTFIPVTSITSGKNFSITADVFCLPIQIVNIVAIGNPRKDMEWVLVDAGMPKSADTILEALKKHFDGEHPPKSIIITHGHFDHVGGLVAKLSRIFPREPVNLASTKVSTLTPDGSIPDLPNWRWIHTPG